MGIYLEKLALKQLSISDLFLKIKTVMIGEDV